MKACWKEDAQVVASEPHKETTAYEVFKVKLKGTSKSLGATRMD
ncbi:MAG: hypothetical protein ACYS3N_01850 [Planctomycetota bacterium]|jgi:hypothetical protein